MNYLDEEHQEKMLLGMANQQRFFYRTINWIILMLHVSLMVAIVYNYKLNSIERRPSLVLLIALEMGLLEQIRPWTFKYFSIACIIMLVILLGSTNSFNAKVLDLIGILLSGLEIMIRKAQIETYREISDLEKLKYNLKGA